MNIRKSPNEKQVPEDVAPAVSVILPVGHTVHTLRETIISVLQQDYNAWELLIVPGQDISPDDSELVGQYAESDGRIRVIEERPLTGTACLLNAGIRHAKGEYIALVTGDGISDAGRLRAQVAYMEEKRDVGVTQFYQRCIGSGGESYIHRPPVSAEAMKAKLLFFCEVCLSAVMIRKSVLDEHQLLFRPESQCPEYDFWIRMAKVTAIETIPEIYGACYVDGLPPSGHENAAAQAEMCELVAGQLMERLEMEIPQERWYLLGSQENIFSGMETEEKRQALMDLQDVLFEVWRADLFDQFYPNDDLVTAIAAKWRWSIRNVPWQGEVRLSSIGQALDLRKNKDLWSRLSRHVAEKWDSAVQTARNRRDEERTEHLARIIRNALEDEPIQQNWQ